MKLCPARARTPLGQGTGPAVPSAAGVKWD